MQASAVRNASSSARGRDRDERAAGLVDLRRLQARTAAGLHRELVDARALGEALLGRDDRRSPRARPRSRRPRGRRPSTGSRGCRPRNDRPGARRLRRSGSPDRSRSRRATRSRPSPGTRSRCGRRRRPSSRRCRSGGPTLPRTPTARCASRVPDAVTNTSSGGPRAAARRAPRRPSRRRRAGRGSAPR